THPRARQKALVILIEKNVAVFSTGPSGGDDAKFGNVLPEFTRQLDAWVAEDVKRRFRSVTNKQGCQNEGFWGLRRIGELTFLCLYCCAHLVGRRRRPDSWGSDRCG